MVKNIVELIEIINVEKDREKLFRWYQNGHARNLPEIMTAALRQAIRLKAQGFDPEDDFENAVFHALAGYEIALSIKNNVRTAASRTRNLLNRLKPLEALRLLMNSTDEKIGLKILSDMHLAEFTFESVVVTYPKKFFPHEVIEAQRRLDQIFANRPEIFIYPKIERSIF
jgi:hypothetical protein